MATHNTAGVATRVRRSQRSRWRIMRYLRKRCLQVGQLPRSRTIEDIDRELGALQTSRTRGVQAVSSWVRGDLFDGEPDPMGRRVLAELVRSYDLASSSSVGSSTVADPYPTPPFPVGSQLGLGLNGMKLYEYDHDGATKYGDAESQWRDVVDLQVGELRQFGPVDLLWNSLASYDNRFLRVPVPVGADAVLDLVLNGNGGSDGANVRRFAVLLSQAYSAGVKLRFTFLTLGGGSELTLSKSDHEVGTDTVTTASDLPDVALDQVSDSELESIGIWQKQVLRLYWSEDHIPPGLIYDWTPSFIETFELASLNLQSSYKRSYLGIIAGACAELLYRAEQLARTGTGTGSTGFEESFVQPDLDLDAVVAGIEIFNEVHLRNFFKVPELPGALSDVSSALSAWFDAGPGAVSPMVSGWWWGMAWAEAAWGFTQRFRSLRGDAGPPLLLPGVASYSAFDDDDDGGKSWTYTVRFLGDFLTAARVSWHLLRSDAGLGDDSELDLGERVGGMDYHWYHYKEPVAGSAGGGGNIGALHAGWLASEVAALGDMLMEQGFSSAEVTVFESGTRATPAGTIPTYIPAGVDPQDFQASDLYRRLLAARGGGAAQAGWHPWMATNSGDYTNMGLRIDDEPGTASALKSSARRSYFAYSRLALLFGADVGVTVLHPPIPSRDDLKLEEPTPPGSLAGTAPWAADDGDVWIFEFTGLPDLGEIGGRSLGTDYTHGYLVMLDPVADGPATKEIPAAAAASADPLRLKPFVEEPDEWLDDAVEADETTLPAYDMAAVMADPEILSDLVLPADLPLNRGANPSSSWRRGPLRSYRPALSLLAAALTIGCGDDRLLLTPKDKDPKECEDIPDLSTVYPDVRYGDVVIRSCDRDLPLDWLGALPGEAGEPDRLLLSDEDSNMATTVTLDARGASGSITVLASVGELPERALWSDADPTTIHGADAQDHLGANFEVAGDIDADGHPDLVASTDDGAWVLYGPLDRRGDARAYGYGIWTVEADEDPYFSWSSVPRAAGDLNADGFADLAVPLWGNSLGKVGYGDVAIITGPVTDHVELTDWPFVLGGGSEPTLNELPNLVGGVDFSGDGFDDLCLTRPEYYSSVPSTVRCFLGPVGSSLTGEDADLMLADDRLGREEDAAGWDSHLAGGENWGYNWGEPVLLAGDVDGDGLPELAMTAWSRDIGGFYDNGVTWLVPGTLAPGQHWIDDVAVGRLQGSEDGLHLGAKVAANGDVDGDGSLDLAAVAGHVSETGNTTHLFLGPLTGTHESSEAIQLMDRQAVALSMAHDLDGDDIDDLVISDDRIYRDESDCPTDVDIGSTALHLWLSTRGSEWPRPWAPTGV